MRIVSNNDLDAITIKNDARKETTKLNGKLGAIEKMQLGFPEMTTTGKIKNTCENTRHAIKLMGITCEYDEFHDNLIIGGQAIGQYAGELSDHACLVLRKMIEEHYDFDPGRERMFDTCVQLCLEGRIDPIVDYLKGLRWDGVGRIDTWLTTYFGATDTELNRAIGRISLVAQVRRARQPGCKFDQIIVLESPEGYFKSTALSVLAGGPENFSDQTILGRGDKEQQELLRGVWLYEIADLSNIRKAEVEHVKAFASRTHDRARPAYGRARIDLPRRCVVWATTNNSEYLKSQSGNRRFWPIPVGIIDIEALKRDRDLLFAEAVILDDDQMEIVLPQDLWPAAAIEQEQRREADPWEDILREVKGELVQYGSAMNIAFSRKNYSRPNSASSKIAKRQPCFTASVSVCGNWAGTALGKCESATEADVDIRGVLRWVQSFHRNSRSFPKCSLPFSTPCFHRNHCNSIEIKEHSTATSTATPLQPVQQMRTPQQQTKTVSSRTTHLRGRRRYADRTRMVVVASYPREGKVQRAVRRCFIAGDGKPRTMSELVAWAYPKLDRFECWHRWNVRRALLRIARPIGRNHVGRGAPGIWAIDH